MKQFLARALADVGELPAGALDRMAEHWALVRAWNARVNLTSIDTDENAAWLHYRDSLEPLRLLGAGPWVDMGSGAGYPGVPLAIARPDVEVTLVEPRRKRASFLVTVTARLELRNVRVLEARSTDAPDRPYAALVTRATFSSEEELRSTRSWVGPGGMVVALRAHDAPAPADVVVHRYELRGESRALHLWRV